MAELLQRMVSATGCRLKHEFARNRFAEETKADFPLLSDPSKTVAKAYGVLHLLGYAKRHTIYISNTGNVLKIDTSVNPETSAEDMASTLGELGVATR